MLVKSCLHSHACSPAPASVQDESSRRSTGRSDSQSTNSQPAIAAASLLTTLLMTLLMTSIACSITTAAAACPVGDPPTASDAPPAAAAATTPSETTPPAGPLAPRNFISSEQLRDRIIALANAAPTRSTVSQIGVSRDGLPIQVVTSNHALRNLIQERCQEAQENTCGVDENAPPPWRLLRFQCASK